MSENIMDTQAELAEGTGIANALRTIIIGGLIVGTLDGIAACVNASTRGVMPNRVFQYISSALLGGESAYAGGATTILLGILMHYSIALGVSTVYYTITSYVPAILRRPFISGPVYGVIVYFMMGYVFVPLTLVQQGAFNVRGLITGLLIHMTCVGLSIALWTRRARTLP